MDRMASEQRWEGREEAASQTDVWGTRVLKERMAVRGPWGGSVPGVLEQQVEHGRERSERESEEGVGYSHQGPWPL